MTNIRNTIYYQLKPLFPRWFQLFIRRKYVAFQAGKYKDVWPLIMVRAILLPDGPAGLMGKNLPSFLPMMLILPRARPLS